MTGLPFKEVAAAALDRSEILVSSWLPDGKRQGDEWVDRNPKRPSDKKAGSFSVNLKTGVWKDFATDDGGADLVSLYAFLFTGGSQKEALHDLALEVGTDLQKLTDGPRKPSAPCPAPTAPRPAPVPPATHPSLGKHTGEYPYLNSNGDELYRVRRYDTPDGKEYRPLLYTGVKWIWNYPPEPRPLYGLDRLADKSKSLVLIVEGEKAADSAAKLFPAIAVITSPAGAKAAAKADWTPLKGREVVIWPDNDKAGLEYAGEVHALLKAMGITIRVVEVSYAVS